MAKKSQLFGLMVYLHSTPLISNPASPLIVRRRTSPWHRGSPPEASPAMGTKAPGYTCATFDGGGEDCRLQWGLWLPHVRPPALSSPLYWDSLRCCLLLIQIVEIFLRVSGSSFGKSTGSRRRRDRGLRWVAGRGPRLDGLTEGRRGESVVEIKQASEASFFRAPDANSGVQISLREDKDSLHILQSICTGAIPDGPFMDDRHTSAGPPIDKPEVPNEVLLPEAVPSGLHKHGVEAWVEFPHRALVHHQDHCEVWDDGGLAAAHPSAGSTVGCAVDALAVGVAASHIQIRVAVHPPMMPRVWQPMAMKRLRVVEGTNGVPSRVNPVNTCI
uniref:Uncharacterized protein n=2 Tax=Oryza barthii TaxID=65489 RepID=A0A0D3HWQ6_9ORYZ